MPYYSVRITGGDDCKVIGVQARHYFGGASLTIRAPVIFFMYSGIRKRIYYCVMSKVLSEIKYKVEVKRISKDEYNWWQR